MSYKEYLDDKSITEKFTTEDALNGMGVLSYRYNGYLTASFTNIILGRPAEKWNKYIVKINISKLKKYNKINSVMLTITPVNINYDKPIYLTLQNAIDDTEDGQVISSFEPRENGKYEAEVGFGIFGKEDGDIYLGVVSDDAYKISSQVADAPTLRVNYTEYDNLLENKYAVSGTVGEGIQYEVDARVGDLTVLKSLYQFEGAISPMSLNMVYQGYNCDKEIQKGLGFGWKLNYYQKVDFSNDNVTYLDASGYTHKFEATNESDKFYDTLGTGLILTVLSSGGYEITNGTNEYLNFNQEGYLTSITKKIGLNNISTMMEYDSNNRLVKITDPMENEVVINYINSTTVVISSDKRSDVILNLSSNLINTIYEKNGRVTTFTHCETSSDPAYRQILSITNDNGEKVKFTYLDRAKIVRIEDLIYKDGEENELEKRELNYSIGATKITNNKDIKKNFIFDIYGKLISVSDDMDSLYNNEEIEEGAFSFKKYKLLSSDRYVLKEKEFNFYENEKDEQGIPIQQSQQLEEYIDDLSFVNNKEYLVSFVYKIGPIYRDYTEYRKTYLAVFQNGVELGRVQLDINAKDYMSASFTFRSTSTNKPIFKLFHVDNIGTIKLSDVIVTGYNKQEKKVYFNIYDPDAEALNFQGVTYYSKDTHLNITEYKNRYGEVITCNKSVYENDMIEMFKNYYLSNGGLFDVWHDNKKGLISNVKDVKINGINLSDIKMCTVFETEYKKTISYNDYTTINYTDFLVKQFQDVIVDDVVYENYTVYNKNFLPIETFNYEGVKCNYEYNIFGNLRREIITSVNGDLKITKEYKYSYDYKWLEEEITLTGNLQKSSTKYSYNTKGLLEEIELPNGLKYTYGYYDGSQKLKMLVTGDSTLSSSNNIEYDKDLIINMSHKNFVGYDFLYDKYNFVNKVNSNYLTTVKDFASYGISFDNDLTELTKAYPSGYKEKVITDKYGNVISKKHALSGDSFSDIKEYYYSIGKVEGIEEITDPNSVDLLKTKSAKIRKIVDKSINNTTRFRYDSNGNVVEVTNTHESNPGSVDYSYTDDRLTSMTINCLNDIISTGYYYRNNGDYPSDEIVKVSVLHDNTSSEATYSIETTNDYLNRLQTEKRKLNDFELVTQYGYPVVNGETSTLFNSVVYNSSTEEVDGRIDYSFDNMNRIVNISDSVDANNISYEYDILGRLTRENNEKLSKSFRYSYDDKGNITKKEEGNYTVGSFAANKTVNYNYSTTYTDRLTSFDGQEVTYDLNGNITKLGTKTFTWTRGNKLSSVKTSSTNTINFDYDGDGRIIRRRDTIGIEHKYVYDGNKLICVDINHPLPRLSNHITYIYAGDEVIGFSSKNIRYLFIKNIQHDIIGIVDESGNLVAKYVYDAWGNHTVYDGNDNPNTNTSFIGNINPFRYRGYYYDVETGLFMVGHRYYNPELGRWLSPDDIEYLDPQSINGLNLYAYCNNDPVNNYDPTGHMAISTIVLLLCIGVGVLVGGTYAGVTAYKDGARGWELVGWTALGAAVGVAVGGLVGYYAGPMAANLFGSGVGFMFAGGLGTAGIAISGALAGTLVTAGAVGLTAVGALAANNVMTMSRPNSGRIRFSDGTGIDPETGKPVTSKERAYEIYHSLKDPIEKAKWRQWMKGKGWRISHLK